MGKTPLGPVHQSVALIKENTDKLSATEMEKNVNVIWLGRSKGGSCQVQGQQLGLRSSVFELLLSRQANTNKPFPKYIWRGEALLIRRIVTPPAAAAAAPNSTGYF